MKQFLWGLVPALLLAFLVSPLAGQEKGAAKKLLVITESKGYVHSVVNRQKKDLALAEQVLSDIGKKSGAFEAVCSQDSRKEITAENLRNFDAVFFYTSGQLPQSAVQKSDLLAFVRGGRGFGGSHSASDTFYQWAQYGELLGGYFDGHPWHQKVKVIIEDPKHPATRHLAPSFEITDEIYQFKGPYSRDKLRILMRLDMTNLKAGRRSDQDNALAWVHRYGKGRVFYTALGHRDDVWRDQRYQQHLLGGIRYILGLEEATDTPGGTAK